MVTYKEFCDLVPKETKDMIDVLMHYVGYYIVDDNYLEFNNLVIRCQHRHSKLFFLLLYAITSIEEYQTMLKNFGFNRASLRFDKDSYKKDDNDKLFQDACLVIPNYKDKVSYRSLTPLDIVIQSLNRYDENCSHNVFNELFPNLKSLTGFKNILIKYNKDIKEEAIKNIEEKVYKDLPISVISLLETASKARGYILDNCTISKNVSSQIMEDIVPLSLLIATFYYDDTPIKKGSNISIKNAIVSFLESKGVSTQTISRFSDKGIFSYNSNKNVYAVVDYFLRYAKDGVNKGVNSQDVTVMSVLENVFDRDFTESLIIERILAKLGCPMSDLTQFSSKIKDILAQKIKDENEKYLGDFYNKLSKEVKEFIDTAAKIYIIILEKMKNNTHNTKLLSCTDDADTLALLIASYYFSGDVSEYYIDKGIKLENIFSLLNIDITKEEIDNTLVDERVLFEKLKRFVYDGVNRGKPKEQITINSINHNLCDREFNKSMIMESIYTEVTKDYSIKARFLKQLTSHLETKEKNRQLSLMQDLFMGLDAETIKYLEDVSKIHKYLNSNDAFKNWNEEDIRPIALLIGLLKSKNDNVKGFWNSLGFTLDKIEKHFSINIRKIPCISPDLAVLSEQYKPYIFEGNNKDLQHSEITVLSIASNVFNKKLNNRVHITKFLSEFKLSYDDFESFSSLFTKYLQCKEQDALENSAKDGLKKYSRCFDYLFKTFSIHSELEVLLSESEFIKNAEDIKVLSLLLALYKGPYRKYFMHEPITLDNILAVLGIRGLIQEEKNISYIKYANVFSNFLNDSSLDKVEVNDLFIKSFDPTITNSEVLKRLCFSLGKDYNVFKVEVITGEPYEKSLSINDRIAILKSLNIPSVDVESVESVLNFGSSLIEHSKYIHSVLPQLVESDHLENATASIENIVSQVYSIEEPVKPKSFWSRLFGKGIETPEPTVIINKTAISELRSAIDASIESLKSELIGYDSIKKYIEAYRDKNRAHLELAYGLVEDIKSHLEKLDPLNEDQYSDYLSISSSLQIIQDKSNRFATTNHLMQQELLRVNQTIVNHFITINALEMARDDLLPLVGTELAIGKGLGTEKEALALSKNVVDLFQALLTKNVDGTIQNVELLKSSILSKEVYATLNKDISNYLLRLEQSCKIGSEIGLALMPSQSDSTEIEKEAQFSIPSESKEKTLEIKPIEKKE